MPGAATSQRVEGGWRQTARPRTRRASLVRILALGSAILILVARGAVLLRVVVAGHTGLAAAAVVAGRAVLLLVLLVGRIRVLVAALVRVAFLVGRHHELRGCDRGWSRTTLRRRVLFAGSQSVSA